MNSQGGPIPAHNQRKSVARRLRDRLAYSLDPVFNSDRLLVRTINRDIAIASNLAASPPARTPQHLLVAPKGWGNIGDQAMIEAFFQSTTLPVTLLVEHADAHFVPTAVRDRVTTVVMPDLFVSRPWVRRRVRRDVASLIARHSTLSVVGADIMDGGILDGGNSGGGYAKAESAFRLGLLSMCNELNTSARVLGFSWNSGLPSIAVLHALRLSQPQALLCVRDPHSLARLRQRSDSFNLKQVADTVFTIADSEPYEPMASWIGKQSGRQLVLMNASGVLARKGIGTEDYLSIARHLLERSCSIVLLPHTIRSGDDDLMACAELYAQLGSNPNTYLVEELLNPRQIAGIASHASAVFTGRMHLSILALNQGVPAVILSTQGKISGLVELFEITDLMIEPIPGFATEAIKAISKILDSRDIDQRVAKQLPKVRALAALNFADLESSR